MLSLHQPLRILRCEFQAGKPEASRAMVVDAVGEVDERLEV